MSTVSPPVVCTAMVRNPVQVALFSPLDSFCADEFTVAELRRIYEIVWGAELDSRNFHRKVTGTGEFLAPTGRTTTRDGGRPAQLYRPGELRILHPPMTRATDSP
jgi:8-oxo-dGTP diphosphatase